MKTAIKALVLVMVLLILTAIPVLAGQSVGSSPYAADLLVSGLNTGHLNPGQEYWYAYSRMDLGDPTYNSIILSLNFEAEGRAVSSRVNFQVFNFAQVESWLEDTSGPIDSLGLGVPASADFDVNTGERYWAGPMGPTEVYYVRIFNISPSPVQYRLTALGQQGGDFATAGTTTSYQPEVIPAGYSQTSDQVAIAESIPAAATVAESLDAMPLLPDDVTVSTNWLLAAQAINGLPPREAAAWLMSAAALGWLPVGDGLNSPAMVPVNPNAGNTVVTTGDGSGDSGVTPPNPPDPTQGYDIYPNDPVPLVEGANIGRLAPGVEHWYMFRAGKLDGKLIEPMSLTIFFTPGEPNIANLITFEMFTGSQYQIWERGTPDDMQHFGVGSWVSRDGAYNTGERLWHGTVVDGDRYYIKLNNDSNEWIDYYLMTGDIYNIEMGEPAQDTKSIPQYADLIPAGRDIGSPLGISSGTFHGRLEAGEDIWYSFESTIPNPDKVEFHNYEILLKHTPGAGHISNQVNVEIYPYQEQQLWQRGDTDQIIPLGVGMDLEYHKATDTHSFVWDGHLVSNTTYFIRVRNDSITDIDYDLLVKRKR